MGPLEARFFAQLIQKLDLDASLLAAQHDRAAWPRIKVQIAQRFRTRSRADWSALLEGTDVCFAPVLSFAEAPDHPHLRARATFVDVDGVVQPAPAPRFSRTIPALPRAPNAVPDADPAELLAQWSAAR